ncbi:MAG: peptide ABC transporter substrate-binding protein [Devosia sp.]
MRIKQAFQVSSAAGVAALMLSGSAFAVTLNLHNGGDARTLDPNKESVNVEDRIISDCFEGLMTIDPKGEPVPGQATSFDVTPDGLTYTFHLRDGIMWSDGTPVVAQDFLTGLEHLENPKTAAEYAYLANFIAGVADYNAGKSTDPSTLGIKALDDKTVQYTLASPTPYFTAALTHPSLYPIPTADYKANGEDWASVDHILCNGPYQIKEWVPGSYVRSEKNAKYYDAANVKIDEVYYHVLEDNAAALNRYRAGEFDIMTDLPTDQLALIQKELPGQARLTPIISVYYYMLNELKKPFDDVEIRKALSMAINRDVITGDILGTGDVAAYSWVPPGVANYQGAVYTNDWQTLPYEERVKQAAAIMASKGYTPENPLKATLRYNTNDNHRRIAVAIAAMWAQIGVQIDLLNAETGVHYDALSAGDFEIGRAGWIMDYNDASNMLDILRSGQKQPDGTINWGNNYGRYSNPKFDALMDQAAKELDLVKRAGIMHEAEKLAMDEYGAVPIYDYVTKWVVSPKISGYEDNAVERHLTRYLSKSE